jgi:glucose dehydrogenase
MSLFTRIALAAGILLLTLFVATVLLAGPFGSPTALIVALSIAVLIAAGSLLYGRDSHGAKAVERKRPAQEALDRAAALAADSRRATAEAAKRGERYCPLDPAHRPQNTAP